MYLRETRRTNRDGSVVAYLQLAHNERHPDTGSPVAKVIHNFGRAEKVDRDALARLVSSISRFLTPEQAISAAAGAEVEVLDSRHLGGAWTLDRVWEQLGIGTAIRRVAAGRRLDGAGVERVVFALVAQRALEPGSKLAGTKWVAQRVAIGGCAGFSEDAAYAAMDFLLDALAEIAGEIFGSVAHLLNLDLDIVFVDTTSTYFELDVPDELAQLQDTVEDDEVGRPVEAGSRAFGHSKDFRADLPQVVIAMAVTRDGVPVRCWTFPGNTADTAIIRTVKDDLAGWNLRRMVWVADRGFASAANRAYLTRGGGHYIHAEKLRNTNSEAAAALARPGRYRTVAGNLRVKEVAVAPGGHGDGDDGARAQRFVVCHNPEQADRDAAVRERLVAHLKTLIVGSDGWTGRRRDEFLGSLKTKPGLRRYLRRTGGGLLRVDAAAIKREAHLDGKWLLRTSDATLTPEDLAAAYKQLLQVERGWRDMKGALALRPVFHYREDRIRSHVQLCWLALLLLRVIENATGDTWRNTRQELDRMHLVTLATPHGHVAQRSTLTAAQKTILAALNLPEPPRFFDFTAPSN
ncbi:MAG: IS1634 family transposase [Geodermatophilaceae bacterium]|nr:IS1634 family transposase [Geodermatophilaceae bacterium]